MSLRVAIQDISDGMHRQLDSWLDLPHKREIENILKTCPLPREEEAQRAKAQSCHVILGELCLGSSQALIESTQLRLRDDRYMHRPMRQHTNPQGFEVIVTVCTTREIVGDCLDLMEQDLAKALYPVQLFHVGRVIYDDSEQWMALVHDCTLPETPLAQTALPEDADSYKELNEQKRRVLEAIPVTQWFAPTFAQIDKAVFGKTKTLVHCRAGMSRSATLLAAYLIRRFGLSAEDSLNFLKKKRACVDSKFTEALKKYANCLGIRDC